VVFFGLVYGFFRVHIGFRVGFLINISYQDLFKVSLGCLSRALFRIQTGKNKATETEKQRDRKQRSRGAGRRAARTHD